MSNYFINRLNEIIRATFAKLGYSIDIRKLKSGAFPVHIEDEFAAAFKVIREKSLLPWEASHMNFQAAKWVAEQKIAGDIVECGVFKGASIVFFAQVLTAIEKGADRKYWLYDTYEGMSEPTDRDSSLFGPASKDYEQSLNKDGTSNWCNEGLEEVSNYVKANAPGIDAAYVKGKVEDTLKEESNLPKKIAVLRLDTDFYDSTKAELEYLYPRLATNGVLIIDDYSFWKGCKEAVDEYFAKTGIKPAFFLEPQSGRVMHFKTG